MYGQELIICTSWKPDCSEFLDAMRIRPGGFGSQLFENVFDAIFMQASNLKSEYAKYYSVEYANLYEFIYNRYGYNLSEVELEKDYIFYSDRLPQILDDAYEDNKLDTVIECIRRLEEKYENKA